MKSGYQIAKELGITPQAIYKRITPELLTQLGNHVVTDKGYRFDDEGEKIVKSLFNRPTVEPVVEVGEPAIEVVEPLVYQLTNEVEYLRAMLEAKENDLRLERQRNHDLALHLSEITKNNQVLIGIQKQGFFRRLFSRR